MFYNYLTSVEEAPAFEVRESPRDTAQLLEVFSGLKVTFKETPMQRWTIREEP